MEPAPITISKDIKNIGIVNRSLPDSNLLSTVHKINSLEFRNINKEGSLETIKGLQNGLTETKRFEVVKLLNQKLLNPGGGVFPSPLGWSEVEKICQQNNVTALYVLEVFDTDLKLAPVNIPKDLSNPMEILSTIQQQVTIITTVKTGWRIYEPQSKLIRDEFTTAENITYSHTGINPITAAEAIIGRKEAIKQLANKMGYNYSNEILPYWITVSRDYYVKGTGNFKIAKRKARTGNWDQAGALWEKETTSKKRKIAGRAAYNMAIINEINGNTDTAIQWAQKSYEDYNNRLALKYVNMLKYRKKQSNRLHNQQQN